MFKMYPHLEGALADLQSAVTLETHRQAADFESQFCAPEHDPRGQISSRELWKQFWETAKSENRIRMEATGGRWQSAGGRCTIDKRNINLHMHSVIKALDDGYRLLSSSSNLESGASDPATLKGTCKEVMSLEIGGPDQSDQVTVELCLTITVKLPIRLPDGDQRVRFTIRSGDVL